MTELLPRRGRPGRATALCRLPDSPLCGLDLPLLGLLDRGPGKGLDRHIMTMPGRHGRHSTARLCCRLPAGQAGPYPNAAIPRRSSMRDWRARRVSWPAIASNPRLVIHDRRHWALLAQLHAPTSGIKDRHKAHCTWQLSLLRLRALRVCRCRPMVGVSAAPPPASADLLKNGRSPKR